jgi:ATP-dependent DNA helicase RecG
MRESENIELKKSTSELKEGIISIVSILNKHKKGELYFGLDSNGKSTKQTFSEKTLRDISQAISNHIEPKIYPKIK